MDALGGHSPDQDFAFASERSCSLDDPACVWQNADMADLTSLFGELRALLSPEGVTLRIITDEPEAFSANTTKQDAKGRPVFYGSVALKPGKVSFHLMPVYCFPELLDPVSPALRKRMQGKSCFNFTARSDPALLAELAIVVERARERYRAEGML